MKVKVDFNQVKKESFKVVQWQGALLAAGTTV